MPVDTFGNPTLVNPGSSVDAAGENARTLRVVRTYPTAADRDQDLPSPFDGEVVFVATIGPQIREGGVWKDIRTADDAVPWTLISGKPSTFPPSSHAYTVHSGSVPWADLSGVPGATSATAGIVQLANAVGTGDVTRAPTAALADAIWDKASDALPKAGGTITGSLVVAGAPTTSNNNLPGWRQLSTSDRTLVALVSSLRYKRSVEPVDVDELVGVVRSAAAKLITWQEKGSPEDSPRYSGISAEDAFEIVPAAVALDEKGRPDSVEPANAFAVPVLAAVAQLLDRIDALEQEVAALRDQTPTK